MEETVVKNKRRRRGRGLRRLLLLLLIAAIAFYFFVPAPLQKRVRMELRAGSYPEDLLRLGRRNPDALDFVLGWNDGHAGDYSAAEIDINADYGKGDIPLLLQWDSRWGYAPYGTNIMGLAGCAPTCLSMVVVGLTGNTDANPLAVADYSDAQGWYVPGVGTSWELVRSGGAHYGLQCEELPISREAMLGALDDGKCIIANMLPGDFTTAGHFIVISGYEDAGFRVLDPNSPTRSGRLWGYTALQPQLGALWAYST